LALIHKTQYYETLHKFAH